MVNVNTSSIPYARSSVADRVVVERVVTETGTGNGVRSFTTALVIVYWLRSRNVNAVNPSVLL
jgi:hypothetical protein